MRVLRAITLLVLLSCLNTGIVLANKSSQRQLVLVTAKTSKITTLQQAEVRRLFLGVAVIKDDNRIHPVRNKSSDLLYQVFLQKVVFMSSRQYERHLITQMFRHGGEKSEQYTNVNNLINKLKKKPNSVTFMWMSTVRKTKGIRIVQSLWTGQID